VSELDSLVGEVAAHEGLLEDGEDFFGEILNYYGITFKNLRGFHRFLRGGGGISNKNLIKKKKDKLIKILKIIISDFNKKSNSSKLKNKKWLKT
jgi:hypothetical protein